MCGQFGLVKRALPWLPCSQPGAICRVAIQSELFNFPTPSWYDLSFAVFAAGFACERDRGIAGFDHSEKNVKDQGVGGVVVFLVKAIYVVAALHTEGDLGCLEPVQELRFVVVKLDFCCSIPVRESTWRRLFGFHLFHYFTQFQC